MELPEPPIVTIGFSGSATFRPQDPQTDFVSHGTRIAVPLAWIRSRRLLGWIRHDQWEAGEIAIFVLFCYSYSSCSIFLLQWPVFFFHCGITLLM